MIGDMKFNYALMFLLIILIVVIGVMSARNQQVNQFLYEEQKRQEEYILKHEMVIDRLVNDINYNDITLENRQRKLENRVSAQTILDAGNNERLDMLENNLIRNTRK